MKLSSRSPKDVTTKGDKFAAIYSSLLDQRRSDNPSVSAEEADKNARLGLLYRASTEAMRVHSAAEGIALLLKSRRIYWDLTYFLALNDDGLGAADKDEERDNVDVSDLAIVVRPWENIALQNEFRGFVHGGRFTALSQYFTQLHFPELVERKSELEQRIVAFWHRVKHAFAAYDKYVIDFAIVDDDQGNEKMVVLELNPFNISTGTNTKNQPASH